MKIFDKFIKYAKSKFDVFKEDEKENIKEQNKEIESIRVETFLYNIEMYKLGLLAYENGLAPLDPKIHTTDNQFGRMFLINCSSCGYKSPASSQCGICNSCLKELQKEGIL